MDIKNGDVFLWMPNTKQETELTIIDASRQEKIYYQITKSLHPIDLGKQFSYSINWFVARIANCSLERKIHAVIVGQIWQGTNQYQITKIEGDLANLLTLDGARKGFPDKMNVDKILRYWKLLSDPNETIAAPEPKKQKLTEEQRMQKFFFGKTF